MGGSDIGSRDGGGYDAFISYSRAASGHLAHDLQRALSRFAKPWYRRRALRVFRDDANLSANAGLWTSIERSLDCESTASSTRSRGTRSTGSTSSPSA
jgi:hypothetical protein